jgi:hypothetical protein
MDGFFGGLGGVVVGAPFFWMHGVSLARTGYPRRLGGLVAIYVLSNLISRTRGYGQVGCSGTVSDRHERWEAWWWPGLTWQAGLGEHDMEGSVRALCSRCCGTVPAVGAWVGKGGG